MKEIEDKNGMQGRVKPSPVRGVCGYCHLSVSCVGSWLSRGDSVLLFVPCGPGSVRVCGSVSATLVCYVAICSGACRSSPVGTLLLIGRQDQCS